MDQNLGSVDHQTEWNIRLLIMKMAVYVHEWIGCLRHVYSPSVRPPIVLAVKRQKVNLCLDRPWESALLFTVTFVHVLSCVLVNPWSTCSRVSPIICSKYYIKSALFITSVPLHPYPQQSPSSLYNEHDIPMYVYSMGYTVSIELSSCLFSLNQKHFLCKLCSCDVLLSTQIHMWSYEGGGGISPVSLQS